MSNFSEHQNQGGNQRPFNNAFHGREERAPFRGERGEQGREGGDRRERPNFRERDSRDYRERRERQKNARLRPQGPRDGQRDFQGNSQGGGYRDGQRGGQAGGQRDGYRDKRRDFQRDTPRQDGGFTRERREARFAPKMDSPAPEGSQQWLSPWVQLKYFSYNPAVFPRMLGAASSDAKAGDLIHVYDKNGELFGTGFWNPASRTPLRMLNHSRDPLTEADLKNTLRCAVEWRRKELNLDETTNAYRVLHGDSDGIGGLIVDRYADVLSLEVTTLGVWQRLEQWLPLLHNLCGTLRHVIHVDPAIARMENINTDHAPESSAPVRTVRITENKVQYEVDFIQGHKTGFFCDQRDNRLKLAGMVKDKSVLDLCCYSGGFSIQAKLHGGASEVTAVDLDEKAIAMAKRNANINHGQHHIDFVHADAFVYARQMTRNGKLFDVVLLDPPKFVLGREEEDKMEGIKKYHDLNMLGIQCVRPGGLLVTCSCSGLLSAGEFERVVIKAAQRLGRRLQILETSGPGWDHPYLSTYPEGRYLKVLWARVMP